MLRRLVALLLFALLLPAAAFAQDDADQLFAAARKGDVEAVKALLAKGVSVNSKNRYEATPIFYAADRGHIEVVKLLIEKGADLTVKDTFYGMTPVSMAVDKGHMEIVKLMLEKGGTVPDSTFFTVTMSNNLDLAKTLIGTGKLSSESLTMWVGLASDSRKPEMVELLKKAGAVMPPEANFAVDAATLQSYAGTYKTPDGMDFVIAVKDGRLTAIAPGGSQPFPLGAVDKTTFRPAGMYGASIKFNVADGKVSSMTWKQSFYTVEAKKQ